MVRNTRTEMDSIFVGGDKNDQRFQVHRRDTVTEGAQEQQRPDKMNSIFVVPSKEDQILQFDQATTDTEGAQEQPRAALEDFGFARNMRDVLNMDVQGVLATNFEDIFARDDKDTFGTGFEAFFARDDTEMDAMLAGRADDDKLNRATVVNKGGQKQQLNAIPTAGNFLQSIPETFEVGDKLPTASLAGAAQLVELRIKSDTRTMSRREREDEERELTSILRVCIKTTLVLTRTLATHPELIELASVREDMRMLEAMSGFFFVKLSKSPDCSVGTSAEQALRDAVKTRYIDEIEAMGERMQKEWRQKLEEAGDSGEGSSA